MRWLRSPFKTWVDAVAFLTLLAVVLSGYFHAPVWSAVMGAITLSVLTWGADRWTQVVAKARELDGQWRELAALCWTHDMPWRAVWYFVRGCVVWLVVGVHMGHNLFFGFVSYGFGWVTRLFSGLPG